jgi:hypothetical protein
VHWDETIASYNLVHKNSIPVDVKFLLTLSDKALPLLEKNQDVLDSKKETIQGEGEYLYRSGLTPKELFEIRKKEFFEKQKTYSWLSWNAADTYVKRKLAEPVVTSSLNK